MTLHIPGPEEFAVIKPALVEYSKRIAERMRVHMAKEDGHDGTYGCKRCAEAE